MKIKSNYYIPKVSLGMPVYNGEKYIRKALDSVLSQTFQDYEIIISDNASDDDTQSICSEYSKKDSRIKYVRHGKNHGANWNFNYVMQKSKGEFFSWLAHDDILEPMFIEETVKYLSKQPNAVLVSGDFRIIDQNGIDLGVEKLIKIRSNINWEKRISEFFKYPISNVFFCIYGLMRTNVCKSVMQFVPAPVIAAGSELPVLARFAVAGEIASIPIVLRKYRKHFASGYSSELYEMLKLPVIRRHLILTANVYRLRFDQMSVLWASSLSKDLKYKISIKILFFYFSRVIRISSVIINFFKSRIILL